MDNNYGRFADYWRNVGIARLDREGVSAMGYDAERTELYVVFIFADTGGVQTTYHIQFQ